MQSTMETPENIWRNQNIMKKWKHEKKKKKETYKETVIKNPKGFPKSLAQKFHFHSSNLLKHKNTKNILGFPFPEL